MALFPEDEMGTALHWWRLARDEHQEASEGDEWPSPETCKGDPEYEVGYNRGYADAMARVVEFMENPQS